MGESMSCLYGIVNSDLGQFQGLVKRTLRQKRFGIDYLA